MSIEETFRDWHHGWGVRSLAATLPTETAVLRLIGIVCLAYWLPVLLGQRLRQDPQEQRRVRHWTVTGRSSLFWCGQQLLHDPGYECRTWLAQQWPHLDALPSPETDAKQTKEAA